jgi:hypothetical protein
MLGVRYLRVREDLTFASQTVFPLPAQQTSILGAMDYGLKTDNDMVGPQIGTECFVCLTPRLKVGAEIDAGVLGTYSKQRTLVRSQQDINGVIAPRELRELDRDNDIAFMSEAGLTALYRATPRLTVRAGYNLLYIDGIALAVDNFNTASPFLARESFLNHESDIFFHGASLGFEWTR